MSKLRYDSVKNLIEGNTSLYTTNKGLEKVNNFGDYVNRYNLETQTKDVCVFRHNVRDEIVVIDIPYNIGDEIYVFGNINTPNENCSIYTIVVSDIQIVKSRTGRWRWEINHECNG